MSSKNNYNSDPMLLSKYFGYNTDRTSSELDIENQKPTQLKMLNSNTNTDSAITNSNPDLMIQNKYSENIHYNDE